MPYRLSSFFFFQAEDGIRDFHVTGVQTCALPISHELVVRREEGPDVLGIEHLRARRESDEVDEDDGDDPPLVAAGRGRRLELLAAREAEPGDVRVLLTAVRAPQHSLSVGPRPRGYNLSSPGVCPSGQRERAVNPS